MKQFVALVCLVGTAVALPLDTAVSRGVFLEESASAKGPTFAKGITTACEYAHSSGRNLGDVPAQGDESIYPTLDKAKEACDDMGPDCGGVKEENGQFTLWHGHILKVGKSSETMHLKVLCALPLPNSNYQPGDSATLHGAIWKVNEEVEGLRWKLSNGPVFHRYDDDQDHGLGSRLQDGKSNVFDVDACIELCRVRSDCASGHYCAQGSPGHAGNCYLSGDWAVQGIPVDESVCSKAQNFRKKHDWIKPVMRTDDGQYIKHQWHSKKPIDEARAEDYGI